jgi:hypothetical protein
VAATATVAGNDAVASATIVGNANDLVYYVTVYYATVCCVKVDSFFTSFKIIRKGEGEVSTHF